MCALQRSDGPKCGALQLDRNGYHVSWDAIPAWVCSQCGEPFFESREVELIQKALNELDRESAAFCIGCLLGGIQAISFLDANPEPGSESFSKVSAH